MRWIIASLLAVGLTACSAEAPPAQNQPEPVSDKKVTVYSGRSEALIKPLLENFTKATGITVEVRYGDTAAMAAQLLEEGDKSPADVYLAQDAGALGAVAKKGLFTKLPADVLGKVTDVYKSKSGEWVGVTGRSRVLVYNSDLVKQAELPGSVFDLTGPEWKDKLGIAPTNGSFQAFVTALRVQHGDNEAKGWLNGIKANGAQIRPNNGQIVADVEAGKLSVGLVNHYYVYERAKADGKTVDALKAKLHFFPNGDTGALVNVSGLGLMKKASNDADARAFIDYLLGADGQKYFAEKTYEYPLVAGVATAAGLPALASLKAPAIDLNDLDTLQATVAMIKEVGLA
ncbi:iron ABC transporter substrate-binding protein [Allorhizocola rhizosphaerae]|uniref:iron ABC transporter substrate-binding protein n=1 Tax=Allorhizocola rhizosphaerae TaxID=1872709 RepID=UPI000E3B6E22|nr:iron ABC transporter substrate-binding protein [Allorhizocola rhizosphaerae]